MSKKNKKQSASEDRQALKISPELEAIHKKLVEVQNKYRVAIKNKQQKIKELEALDQEVVKLVGAYENLEELKKTLTPKPEETAKTKEDEPQKTDEGEDTEVVKKEPEPEDAEDKPTHITAGEEPKETKEVKEPEE